MKNKNLCNVHNPRWTHSWYSRDINFVGLFHFKNWTSHADPPPSRDPDEAKISPIIYFRITTCLDHLHREYLIGKRNICSTAHCFKDEHCSFTAKMTDPEKMSLLAEISSLSTSFGYLFRNCFIPRSPNTWNDYYTTSDSMYWNYADIKIWNWNDDN